jgi:hypothetical protein
MNACVRASVAIVSVYLCALTGACGAERAVRVRIEGELAGEFLCVVAHGAGSIVFAQAYPVATLPSGEHSLTFVAGARVADELAISARILGAGAILAGASTRVRFAARGTVDQVLAPRRCHPGGPSGRRVHAVGQFAPLAAPPRLLGTDFDGDGRDELLAIGADGSLQVLDADGRTASSRRETELRALGAVLAATGDLDGDCRHEVVAAGSLGALVVIGSDGRSPSPVGGIAHDVAIGMAAEHGTPALAMVGPSGIELSPWDEDAPRTLERGAFAHVVAGDLTGDGVADLVASGDGGTIVLLGVPGSLPRRQEGALPAAVARATGPIALGDLDGDGALDLASASGAAIRIAINRGDGLLEDRTGGAPATVGDTVVRLALVDLDGDCADEIVALDASGRITVIGRNARGMLAARTDVPSDSVLDVTPVDADGDGARELAMLDASAGVRLWRP